MTESLIEKNPAAVALGRRGGLATSPAKTAAARVNARLGGWPKGRSRKAAPVPTPPPCRVWKSRWRPHRLPAEGADYRVWRNLSAVQAAECHWGATYQDAVAAALKLRELDLLDSTLELWPLIRSRRLRAWAADVMTAARWLQIHPLDTPICARIWPALFEPNRRG